jgi:HTH-type transcriptional regulator/antitoxin HigA
MNPKSIKIETDEDHQRALSRITELWNAKEGTPEAVELDIWVCLVEKYEDEHYPIPLPSPEEAIKFRKEQQGTEE